MDQKIESGELRSAIIDILLATQKQSEGVTADAIIFTIYKHNLERDKKSSGDGKQPAAPLQGAAISCDQILDTFKRAGMHIDIGANFSAKGQIAQLINGARELLGAPAPQPSAQVPDEMTLERAANLD